MTVPQPDPLSETRPPGAATVQTCESVRVASPVMRLLDVAFGHPRGPLGRLGAALVVRGNVEQERWAVEYAGLHARSRVLVVGHGPESGSCRPLPPSRLEARSPASTRLR